MIEKNILNSFLRRFENENIDLFIAFVPRQIEQDKNLR